MCWFRLSKRQNGANGMYVPFTLQANIAMLLRFKRCVYATHVSLMVLCVLYCFVVGGLVIRFRLTELLAERSFKTGRRIEWQEVAEGSGVHRTTLSRMVNIRGYNATMSNVDSLCRFFECHLGQLAEYVADEEVEGEVRKTFRGPPPASGRALAKAPKPESKSKKRRSDSSD